MQAAQLLSGKTAIITGGASGIGLAIAQAFAQQGAAVFILDQNQSGASEAAQQHCGLRRGCAGRELRRIRLANVRAAFASIFERGRVHILVNCAGIAHVGSATSTSEEDFDRIMRINIRGVYLCTRAVLDPMKQQGGGVILNMASIAGMAGLPDRFAYSTSKGAVLAMTYSVARDYLKDRIRCNAISPARVHTPFVDGFVAKNYPGREAEMMEEPGPGAADWAHGPTR